MAASLDEAREALLRLVGLGIRGGLAAPGVEITRSWIRQGKCVIVVIAEDASPRARLKVERLARRAGIPVVTGPDAGTLGHRSGRPPVMMIGVRDRSLAAGILAAARDGLTEE